MSEAPTLMSGLSGEIAVLGAGPAGVATACGLAQLGYRVQLFGYSRTTAIEGLSERTLGLLRRAGLHCAAACVRNPGRRSGFWAGQASAESHEYVVERAVFDDALRSDAASLGVVCRPEWIKGMDPRAGSWGIRTGEGRHQFLAVVDARGRGSRGALIQGPPLLSISQRFSARRPLRGEGVQTRIHALENEWYWLAEDGGGSSWLQMVGESRPSGGAREFSARLAGAIASASRVGDRLARSEPIGVPYIRAAAARLSAPACARGLVRAGDASVSTDALSGHGIYEALASASVAVAAAHTYLEKRDWSIVEQFVNERAREVWRAAVSLAARFYKEQALCVPSPFWTRTAAAYESLSSVEQHGCPSPPRIERRPVLNGSLIELRPVILTSDQPRGVWKLNTVELVPLIEYLEADPDAGMVRLAERFAHPPHLLASAVQWLVPRGLIKRTRHAVAPRSRRAGGGCRG